MLSEYRPHQAIFPALARAAFPGLPTMVALDRLKASGNPTGKPLAPLAHLYDAKATGFSLNPALAHVWDRPARFRVLYGGRASSKTQEAAGRAVEIAATSKTKFACIRRYQNKIAESVYAVIRAKAEASIYAADFRFTKNSIVNVKTGSEFLFYGIERNFKEIKGLEGVHILWIEEAEALTKDQWIVIEPTIREQGSEIWLLFNPDLPDDFVYQNFVVNPPADCISRKINHNENPFLTPTMRKTIADLYARDPKAAEHIYGGEPLDGSDESVINRKFVLAAIDAHVKLGWNATGKRVIGWDVADDGFDTNAACGRIGNVICAIDEWHGQADALVQSATRVWRAARDFNAAIIWDSIGVGASAGSTFKGLNSEPGNPRIDVDPFNAGGAVINPDGVYMELPHTKILNKDHFANVKAQIWNAVAERFRKTYEAVELGIDHPLDELISLDSRELGDETILKIAAELSAPKKDEDQSGKFRVEQKVAMRKRGVKSPNIADSIVLAFAYPKRAPRGFFDLD